MSEVRIEKVFERFKLFSRRTFVDSNLENYLTKLDEEVAELKHDPNMKEVADCMLVLAAVSTFLEGDLGEELERKVAINEKRKWERQPDGTYHHIREG